MKDFYNLIEGYLNQELDESDVKQFEEELTKSPELKAHLIEHQKLLQRLKSYRLRTKVNLIGQSLKVKRKRDINFSIKIAASIALLMGVSLYIYFMDYSTKKSSTIVNNLPIDSSFQSDKIIKQKNDSILDGKNITSLEESSKTIDESILQGMLISSFIPYVGSQLRDNTYKTDSANGNLLLQAEEAYLMENYKLAVKLLSKNVSSSSDERATLLLAHCLMKLKKYQESKIQFKILENSLEFQYEANYNLMLIYFILEMDTEAMLILENILGDKGHPYIDKVNLLLENLNSVKPIGHQRR